MERIYRICGLNISCDFRERTMTARAEKYLSEGEPDLLIRHDSSLYPELKRRNPALDDNECEVIVTANRFYRSLLDFGGFMLHSSAVAVDGRAYLFSAPSGTGKSTHTELWLKLFGERAYILNDDKPALCVTDSGIMACGTPWSGKSDLNVNAQLPIGGICVLKRSEQNYIRRMDEGAAVYSLLNQTIRPEDGGAMSKLLSLLDEVVRAVQVWEMGCNISLEAAQMAYDAMSV